MNLTQTEREQHGQGQEERYYDLVTHKFFTILLFIKATAYMSSRGKNQVGYSLRQTMKFSTICLSLLLLMLTVSPGCIGGDDTETLESIPAFTVVADDDATYSSDNLLGTPYILHFSASWCSQCRPTMHAVDSQLPEHIYIIVSTDDSDSTKLSDWHLQVNESKADSTVDTPFSANAALSTTLNINNTPTLILVGSDGTMIDRHLGPMTDSSVIEEFWSQAV